MDFFMWLFAIKKFGTTYDVCELIYNSMTKEHQLDLLDEYDKSEWRGGKKPNITKEVEVPNKSSGKISETKKLNAGMEFCFADVDISGRRLNAINQCKKLHELDYLNEEKISMKLADIFKSVGTQAWVGPNFWCTNGKNICVGDFFHAEYNVIIEDIAAVNIGDYCYIGSNTIISTLKHSDTPEKRRKRIGIGKPVAIGNDVQIGANCVIMPGVSIGNNVIVKPGSVVTDIVPNNSVVCGNPAKVIKTI